MHDRTVDIHQIDTYDRTKIKGYDLLESLALNLRWSWNESANAVWQQLDPELWEFTHNPWVVLQTVSREKLEQATSDPRFLTLLNTLVEACHSEESEPTWFQKNYSHSPLTQIAYFSMEYMLTEALPIYSGGLGNVAGDQLKAAGDLGVPMVAIGLLYQQGYFRQIIDKEGNQQALYPYNEPRQLPIMPLRKKNGEWLRLEIKLPGYSLWLRAWQAQVGNVKLYLLDSNDLVNYPPYRGITSELYGGSLELRLQQELTLGIAGCRLLKALNIHAEVFHLNEGHAAFAILERARLFMKENKQPFDVALATTRAGNLFTTHTAVSAGFDCFPAKLIEKYLGSYAQSALGITLQDLLALGRRNPQDTNELFNMAYLAIHGSGAINGVSRLHKKVSQEIFSPLFPRWPEDEVPIGYVTNGIHIPSWRSTEAHNLWKDACGETYGVDATHTVEQKIRAVGDHEIWQMRNIARDSLVQYARKQLAQQFEVQGNSPGDIELAKHLFDPNTLTLGFSRRFAAYKRPNMLLHNSERLLGILTNTQRPAQLIIAGKAHPMDPLGQALIRQWIEFINTSRARAHIIFLSDDDMLLTERLVQGVDLWINTPRRPWEACGTSGMKVLVNGGVNLSELDGWWSEAYTPDVGWAIGDGKEHTDHLTWDATEAEILYDLLEHEVVPCFYTRDAKGIPTAWIAKIREGMARLAPHFSASRAVQEYTEKYYIPGATIYQERSEEVLPGKKMLSWQQALALHWSGLYFGDIKIESTSEKHHFEVQVFLNGLDPDAIKIELYAAGMDGNAPALYEMQSTMPPANNNLHLYKASVSARRPADDYTPRVVPRFFHVAIPLEENHILWQK